MRRVKDETNEEKKLELAGKLLGETFPKWLSVHEKRLAAQGHTKFLVGDKITIADFTIGSFLYSTAYNEANESRELLLEVFEAFPLIKEYAANFAAENKAHLDSRPKPRPM